MNTQTNEKLKKLFELIHDIEQAMLVTQTRDGTLRARPMIARTLQDDDSIWFFF